MIRVAGRNISKVSQRAKELFASDKWFQIKESSSNEWKDFIKGCRLVLCSAELGNETVECINRIAGELDCPIVYLGINLPKQEAEGKFIYGAGSIPGLSGIIPQYLAQDFDSVASIDFYYGAKGTFTYTAAKDYMDGVFNNSNRSMVMWKYGKLLPYVPAEVEKTNMYICNEIENMRCFPYFDDESEYLCQKYGLSEGRWHMCISGENTLKVLERARYDYQVNKDKTLRNICRASKLDCFGTTGITKFVCSIAGMVSNEVIEKSLLLTSSNPSRLTGSVAAATVLTILEMGMERGSFLLSKSKINKLKELVRNEGYLIFSETILPETWLLVSQALMMTPPEDTLRDGAAFISKDLWCGVLKESDGVEESVLSIPSNNNPTSLLGAGLFIKQFKRTDVFLDKMEINRRLEKYLPAYMLPSEIY